MLIDVTRLVGRRLKGRLPTGVDRVALAYVERYGLGWGGDVPARPASRALVRLGRLQLILPKLASHRLFQWLLCRADGAGRARAPWPLLLAALPGAVAAALLRSSLRGTGSERPWLINAGHSGLEHAHWARRLREQGARPLLVVHDLIPITHPQYCRAGEADRHAQRMRHALGWAAAVVANSQATLDTLAGWAISQGLTLPAATVAHLGPGSGSGWAAGGGAGDARPLPGPYFVVLGTLEPRKNHALLLRVWERLVQALGAQAVPRLVLIGQRGWDIEALLRDLAHSPGLQGVVLERPRCSDAELARWLRHARALLLPSFAEGYGMPLVEALAAGVPVLASELPVFREVAGAVPDYLDPLDGPAWLAAVTAYAAPDCEARRAQLERMQGFCAPTWARHFAVVDKLIASGLPA